MEELYLEYKYIEFLSKWWKSNKYCNKVEVAALEPLLYKDNEFDIIDIINILKKFDFDVSITTNGYYLKNIADRLDKNSVNVIRVSWHSMDNDVYRDITGYGDLNTFIDSLSSAINNQLPISINRVLLKNYTSDIREQINFVDKYNLRLKLLDLYWTEEISDLYDKFYIPPQEVLKEFIEDGTIVFEETTSLGRNRVRYRTKNNSLIEYKNKETANRKNEHCLNCNSKLNCLEGYADYFRVFPNKKGTFCYMRPELDFDIFDEKGKLILENNDIFFKTPLRFCLVGKCNFNCGFPKESISWCLKRNRDFIFPKRTVK
ncbi:radical SAM protein [Brachyspira intermedia]|uniref:radical SAM protein n=1 Tax=Brachyspira intermedia TaxID=84377 RepID=UPI0030065067